VSRDVISDETWAVLGPLFPGVKATGRPPVDRRTCNDPHDSGDTIYVGGGDYLTPTIN